MWKRKFQSLGVGSETLIFALLRRLNKPRTSGKHHLSRSENFEAQSISEIFKNYIQVEFSNEFMNSNIVIMS